MPFFWKAIFFLQKKQKNFFGAWDWGINLWNISKKIVKKNFVGGGFWLFYRGLALKKKGPFFLLNGLPGGI